jgi:hypothetical protein
MNRFDDALLDLLSSAPRPTPVEVLRARTRRRRRRRRAIGIVALAVVVSAGSVGVAASLVRDTRGPEVAVSPTTSSTGSVDNPWCVTFSYNAAIARGVAYGTVIVDAPIAHAKLVSLAELLDGSNNPLATNDPHSRLTGHKRFWVVELRPTTKSQSPYKWGLVTLDATTGDVVTANEGPSNGPGISEPAVEPPYFDSLPDHAAACPVESPVSTTTTTIDAQTEAVLQGTHAYDPRVDLAIHANASNMGPAVTIDTHSETVLATQSGPEGTVLKLWTYWPNRSTGCVGVVDNVTSHGDPTTAVVDLVTCGNGTFDGDVLKDAPPATPGVAILAGRGSTWISPTNHTYTLIWERDLPTATNVKLVFADGTTQNKTTVAGFWIGYLTPAQESYYREIYSDRDGHVIATRTTDLRCPPGGQCGGP